MFVPVGVPATGGPLGSNFVANWFADLGAALPAGAAVSATRGIVYFNGHGLGGPLLVLGLWAGIAAVALVVPAPPRRVGHGSSRRLVEAPTA